jgi:hypothetical protein
VRRGSLNILLLFVLASGCSRSRPNADCYWPLDDPSRSLYFDAEFAEDLAIRYADAQRGPRSGHFEGFGDYGRTRDQCMARLFAEVARVHGVSQGQVRQALDNRPIAIDLIIALPYLLLYTFAVNFVISRIDKKDNSDHLSSASLVMVGYTSIVTSVAGVLLGQAWSAIAETIRLGNGHLSYRMDRGPWAHHYAILFIAALAVFWCVFACRSNALRDAARWPSTERN